MENIKFADWQKLDLRTGKILKVEDVEGADKLYKLSIDLGKELGKRTLVAGIKQHYTPEQLKEKSCVVFINLEPRKIKGIESQGMILASVNSDETKVFLLRPDEDIELGSKVR
ncbi:MAG: methionine--tRNA ligase subunit beta [Candidatus Pacearchaeota archaeon]|nr:methionine--tRNA ligase subunit beta [Candidatus Pacearchaeota archaeon]